MGSGHAGDAHTSRRLPAFAVVHDVPPSRRLRDRMGMIAPHARSLLPHHSLQVFHVAREMLICVRDAQIRDAKLRDEATRAAKGACLNIAEGAARVTRADKARAYAIARGEAAEVGAAIEIAVLVGAASERSVTEAVSVAVWREDIGDTLGTGHR